MRFTVRIDYLPTYGGIMDLPGEGWEVVHAWHEPMDYGLGGIRVISSRITTDDDVETFAAIDEAERKAKEKILAIERHERDNPRQSEPPKRRRRFP